MNEYLAESIRLRNELLEARARVRDAEAIIADFMRYFPGPECQEQESVADDARAFLRTLNER
jgi:hypothetical protein